MKNDDPPAKPVQAVEPLPSEVLQLVLDKIDHLESLMTANSSGASGSDRKTVIDATSEGFNFEQTVENCGNWLCPHGHVHQSSIRKGPPPLCHLSHCPMSAAEQLTNPGKMFTVNHCWESRKKYPVYTAQKQQHAEQKAKYNEARKAYVKKLKEEHLEWDDTAVKVAADYDSMSEDIQKLHPSHTCHNKSFSVIFHPSNSNAIKTTESETKKKNKNGNFCRGCGLFFHEVCHMLWHTTLIFSDRRSEDPCPCKERIKADGIMDELKQKHESKVASKKDQLPEVEEEGQSEV